MAVNLASERNLLLPGLMDVAGLYPQIPTQWSRVFDTRQSLMSAERVASERYMSVAALKSQGSPIAFDNSAGDRYVYNLTPYVLALGYAITQEAIEDNLYKSKFEPTNLGLLDAFKRTKEILAMAVLNTATTYDSSVGGDGVALCATNHPVDGNTWANRPSTDVDLNEASLENAAITVRYFLDNAGQRIMARPEKLIVSPQNRYVAIRLMETELRVGTANNDVNAVRMTDEFKGFDVMDYLTSSYAWFVKTDIPGLVHLDRVAFDIDCQVDFITKNLLVSGRERYVFNYTDPRAIYGSFPTS